ncbi:MAG: hypothetical protein GX583_04710 [Thermoplasmatales archaeon]|nr:hypothetical protein [Thermoplasmatales archaeon]
MAEYDPFEEMGLTLDKQLVCNCHGLISRNDSLRGLCTRYIRNGDRFYDTVSRYDDLTAHLLGRNDSQAGNVSKFAAPFLKAFGATDHDVYGFFKEDLALMPGAATAVRYVYGLLPTFLATTSYEHHMMNVCDAIDFPMGNVSCTKVEFDSCEIRRQEAKELRDMAAEITALRIPKTEYSPHTPMEMDPGDVNIVSVLDRILADRLPRMDAGDIVNSVSTMGEDEKAYSLLEIRRKTEIDLDSTACIGGDSTDYRALDLVRDSNGLAMSFNGTESAVRGCNVAVMAKDSTVAAVLVQEFYNEGIEAVYDLISCWDRATLREKDCPDRHLMDAMLSANPRRLPEVFIVDRDNVDEISSKSGEYRRRVLRPQGYGGPPSRDGAGGRTAVF